MSVGRLVIFGAGEGGRRAMAALRRGQVVVAFCDNNPAIWNTMVHGVCVLGPQQIAGVDHDRVLIASAHYEAIFDQLVGMGVPMRAIDILAPDILEGRETHREPSRTALVGWVAGLVAMVLLSMYGLWRLVFG